MNSMMAQLFAILNAQITKIELQMTSHAKYHEINCIKSPQRKRIINLYDINIVKCTRSTTEGIAMRAPSSNTFHIVCDFSEHGDSNLL